MSHNIPDPQPVENLDAAEQSNPNRARRLIAGVTVAAIALASGAVIYKEHSGSDATHESHSVANTETALTKALLSTIRVTEQVPTPTPSATEAAPSPKPSATETAPVSSSEVFAKRIKDISPKAQKLFEKLPGFGNQVTAAERAKMRASTVKVALRPTGVNLPDAYRDSCTGLKVDNYVVTARHCFDDSADTPGLFPSLDKDVDPDKAPDLHQTKNITKGMFDTVGIWTIGANGMEDKAHTAPVSQVFVRYTPDVALLKVDTSNPGSARFNAMPAASYDEGLTNKATPGSEVALFSLPEAASGKVVENSGIYLGRIDDPWSDVSRQIDLVSMGDKTPANDSCNYGGSGSVAIVAGGAMTGPLALRNDIRKSETSNGGDPIEDKQSRAAMSRKLGIDLTDAGVLCGFSVITPTIVHNMAQGK